MLVVEKGAASHLVDEKPEAQEGRDLSGSHAGWCLHRPGQSSGLSLGPWPQEVESLHEGRQPACPRLLVLTEPHRSGGGRASSWRVSEFGGARGSP